VSKVFSEQRERGEPVQNTQCVVIRVDFMIHQPTHSLKLVEYNTVATGFVFMGGQTAALHSYVLDKYGDELPLNYDMRCKRTHSSALLDDPEMCKLPFHKDSSAQFDAFVEQFAEAIRLYKLSVPEAEHTNPWVLFVSDPNERNICDQKAIEMALQRRFRISSMRRTLDEIRAEGELNPVSKRLRVAGHEIGFVYFRTGYAKEHYMEEDSGVWDEEKWMARETLECSMAIKCPSIDYHLAGFKKF